MLNAVNSSISKIDHEVNDANKNQMISKNLFYTFLCKYYAFFAYLRYFVCISDN
jgi:hypothetical protein